MIYRIQFFHKKFNNIYNTTSLYHMIIRHFLRILYRYGISLTAVVEYYSGMKLLYSFILKKRKKKEKNISFKRQ